MNNRTRQFNTEGTEEKRNHGEDKARPLRPLFSSVPSVLKIQFLSWLRLRRAMPFAANRPIL